MSLEILHQGRFLRLVKTGRWEFCQRTKASAVVAIVATTAMDEIVLIEQERVPLGRRIIELPAGLVGDDEGHEDEAILEAAQRELDEETGYFAAQWQILSRGPTSAGLTDEVVTFVAARDALPSGGGGGVDGEDIEVHVIPLDEVGEWLAAREASGQLVSPKVYAGLYFAMRNRD
jgi:ADP-ribose pyrophosphatase